MPKVVLDTNIIISALMFGRLPAILLDQAMEGGFVNVTSAHILQEVESVLVNKFCWQVQDARDVVRWMLEFSELVKPQAQITALEYLPDNKILECAVAGQARVIVTGDKKHLLPLKQYRGILILTVGAFQEWLTANS